MTDKSLGSKELPEFVIVRKLKLSPQPRSFSAEELKDVRDQMRVSQAVFAEFLGLVKQNIEQARGREASETDGGTQDGSQAADRRTQGYRPKELRRHSAGLMP